MRSPVCAMVLASAALATSTVHAQGFPTKPMRMVVPFAAGGPADITARHVAPRLGELLGQTVVVDNRAGANGIIGVENVARSAPDGYSMLLATSSATAINMVVVSKLPFDVLRDLIPVSTVVTTGTLFLVHPALPVRSVKDLVALARKRPGEMAMGSSGSGSILHLALELVNIQAGTKITHVPYKGAGPAISDVMAGQINGMFVDLPVASPFVKAGKVRALAIASPERHALFPDLPTMAESGFPEIAVRNWYGLFLPAKTPPEIVSKVHDALGRTLATREVRERLTSIGADPQLIAPEEFVRFVRAEIEKWGKVVKTAGIKIES